MELSDKKIEELISKQADRVAKESDEKFKVWSKESDKKFKVWSKESDERMERYVGAVKEDIDHKLDAIIEIVSSIKEKADITFNEVGTLKPEVTLNTDLIKNHEKRIKVLEAR